VRSPDSVLAQDDFALNVTDRPDPEEGASALDQISLVVSGGKPPVTTAAGVVRSIAAPHAGVAGRKVAGATRGVEKVMRNMEYEEVDPAWLGQGFECVIDCMPNAIPARCWLHFETPLAILHLCAGQCQ
jgi:hypothetical protein